MKRHDHPCDWCEIPAVSCYELQRPEKKFKHLSTQTFVFACVRHHEQAKRAVDPDAPLRRRPAPNEAQGALPGFA